MKIDLKKLKFQQVTKTTKGFFFPDLIMEILHQRGSAWCGFDIDTLRMEHLTSADWPVGLKHVRLENKIAKLRAVPDMILGGCFQVKSVEFRSFSTHITEVGDFFLSSCSGLETIDLSPLRNVVTIGARFLGDCRGLEMVDLTPLTSLTRIGKGFLHQCDRLKQISGFPSSLTDIGDEFLRGCSGLEGELDFSSLGNVVTMSIDCREALHFAGVHKEKITKVLLPSSNPNCTIAQVIANFGCSSGEIPK